MPLDPDFIKQLQAKAAMPKQRAASTRTRNAAGKAVDTTDRTHVTWFKLDHHLIDANSQTEPVFCDNPNCQDPRPKPYGQPVAEVNGQNMCRFCFIDGWLITPDTNQTQMDTDGATSTPDR